MPIDYEKALSQFYKQSVNPENTVLEYSLYMFEQELDYSPFSAGAYSSSVHELIVNQLVVDAYNEILANCCTKTPGINFLGFRKHPGQDIFIRVRFTDDSDYESLNKILQDVFDKTGILFCIERK